MRLRTSQTQSNVERQLPAGTVTFLFTDIEGSTQMARAFPDLYPDILARHRAILRKATVDHNGVIVDSDGDGLFMAFPSAKSAIAAGIDGQIGLSVEPWPSGTTVVVRMGLHTGEAIPVHGNYATAAVHQAARIKDLAHGGQVLVSHATATACDDALPRQVTLKDIGRHSLKDFDLVQLYQVCHTNLVPDFPPPRGSVPAEGSSPTAKPAKVQAPARFVASYRSPDTPRGTFRGPGDIHVHIDGGTSGAAVYETLRAIERPPKKGRPQFPMKFNAILRFSAGPQRDDKAFVQTYRYHTPGLPQRESFDTFSTMWLGNASDLDPEAVDALTTILEKLTEWPGAVVELERVIGVLKPGGRWEEADPPRIADPDALDSGPLRRFARFPTSPIEIHHAIDFPKSGRAAAPILTVDELPTWPNLGGWFLFEKGNTWSYRSSEFVDRSGEFRYAACVGQKRLLEFLSGVSSSYELHTLAEQVLGIWRGGAQPSDESTVPALGEWEMSCSSGGDIWVIAPNFFGDRSPDVRRAMVRNLSQDITYTYFLHSQADVLRLSRLADDLERDLIDQGKTTDGARRTVAKRVRCLRLDADMSADDRLRSLLADDYFVCPSDKEMGGFRLDSSGFSGERIDDDDYQYLVQTLRPLLDTNISQLFSSTRGGWESRAQHQVVVCTDLEGTAVDQDQDSWGAMLNAYDRIVAGQVSMHGPGCVVVRPVRNGYLLVFNEPREAGEWARRLQFDVQWHNEGIARRGGRELPIPTHNIALGYGSVTRILRAHGYDYVGGSIDECIHLADSLRGGQIAMSRMFADQYEARVGKQEFAASTHIEADYLTGDLRLLEWP